MLSQGQLLSADGPARPLFEEEFLLPAQLGARTRLAEPARRMMAAMMALCVYDLQGRGRLDGTCSTGTSGTARARNRAEAAAWVASDDEVWPFSFVNVCSALGLNPALVRQALSRVAAAVEVDPVRGQARVRPGREARVEARACVEARGPHLVAVEEARH